MKNYNELKKYDLLTTVEAIKTALGGRQTPMIDGYRGQFFWHINDVSCTDWLASYVFEYGELHPGETSKCKVCLFGTIKELGTFESGKQFAIREGSKIVAVGSIIEVM